MKHTGIVISKDSSLSPVKKGDLIQYTYYAIAYIDNLNKMTLNGHSSDICQDWVGEDEQYEIVYKSGLWQDINTLWEYAENGLNHKRLYDGYCNDLLSDLYKVIATCNGILLHNGTFSHEGKEVREAGAKTVYKFMARLKIDGLLENGLDDIAVSSLFPMADFRQLTTFEYALLAGYSHIGAVRNEIGKKNNSLVATKSGGTLLISLNEAKRTLINKRKFIPTPGISYK